MGRLGRVLEGLRGVLEMSWRRLGAAWGHLGRVLGTISKNVEGDGLVGRVLGANREAEINKIHVKMQLAFPAVLKHIICDFSCF